jgi:hypothetical protein
MFLVQQAAAMPGWVGPTVALSLLIIALAFVVMAGAAALAAREAAKEMRQLARAMESLRTDLTPALTAVQSISAEGQRLAGVLGGEAEELARASRALREGLRARVANLEAIYEVLEEEIEETALDVATTLRTMRSGVSWYGRLRRLLGGGRRR